MRSIHEQLIKANHSASFAAEDLRRALAKANAVEALVLLPLIADATRLAQQISALIEAIGACESEAQQKLDRDAIVKALPERGRQRDIAPGESQSGFIARLPDRTFTKTSPAEHTTAEGEGLISIELKSHVLQLDDMLGAAVAYADDVNHGRGGILVGALKDFAGCTHVTLSRDDWITVAECLRLAKDFSSAAYIRQLLGEGSADADDPT